MPVRSVAELRRSEGRRRLNKARHGLVDGLEEFERSETRMAEWQKKRRLKQARRDAREGLPFLQIASTFVTSGLLKELRPSSIRTYLALISRCDNVRRETLVGVPLVSKITGLSEAAIVNYAYPELKSCNLIRRRKVARNGFNPFLTQLTKPSEWKLPPESESAKVPQEGG